VGRGHRQYQRTNLPSKPFGKFALVKPGSRAAIPPDAGRIELHSSKAKILARVELKGDPDGAVRLQRAFSVTALGQPVIANPVALPMFDSLRASLDIFSVEARVEGLCALLLLETGSWRQSETCDERERYVDRTTTTTTF
jgi:hypothetical protein